jgi:hypothetical protein
MFPLQVRLQFTPSASIKQAPNGLTIFVLYRDMGFYDPFKIRVAAMGCALADRMRPCGR